MFPDDIADDGHVHGRGARGGQQGIDRIVHLVGVAERADSEHVGQTDEVDLGVSDRRLDRSLWHLVDADAGIEATASELGLERGTVERYASWSEECLQVTPDPDRHGAGERGSGQ